MLYEVITPNTDYQGALNATPVDAVQAMDHATNRLKKGCALCRHALRAH